MNPCPDFDLGCGEASAVGSLSPSSRMALLDNLESQNFDVVVIGGGITGAGVARDAARRGLSVALVEAGDFAVGTSSRSSKLIHGGLRYLAMGDVGLVRSTALERKAVHAMAPHLAEPCWMVVAARSRASLLKFRTAITAYEKLGAVGERDRHQSWDEDAIRDNEPLLRRDMFPWACAYREYMSDDARLVLAVLRDAVDFNAVVASRTPAVELLRSGARVTGVGVECALTGRRVVLRAKAVVNAAGPWVEELARLESPDTPDRLHLSKGVHIVVPADRLDVRNLMILSTADKRSIFTIRRGGVVIIGTSDTTYEGDRIRWPEVDRVDVEYLLEPLARYFDVDPVSPADVVAAWAGVRPLVAQPGKAPKEISRKDEVWTGEGGMVTVAGGKLTGFRAMAATIMESVADQLGHTLRSPPGAEPLPGADLDSDLESSGREIATENDVEQRTADRLVRLYGSDTRAVLARGAAPLVEGSAVVKGEVDWAVEVEAALTLEDVVYRRIRAAWYEPTERGALLEPVAKQMAGLLGWDSLRTEAEVESVRSRFNDELAFENTP